MLPATLFSYHSDEPILMHKAPLLAALSAATIATPAIAQDEDFNVWTGQFATINVDDADKIFVRLEAQERFTNDADRLGQLLLGPEPARRPRSAAGAGPGHRACG